LLTTYFGSVKSAWQASVADLRSTGLGDVQVSRFDRFRTEFDIPVYLRKLKELHIGVVTVDDPRYPKLLREIPDAPLLLYVRGTKTHTPIDFGRAVAVVGTRRVTPYGREVTARLVADLVGYGCTIVSGMAYGVDAVAHEAAIAAGGNTIAVLGCGIDIVAPPSNARLYDLIRSGHGAIVSEMPLGMRPTKGLFPARNRIISGMCQGVVVTEGADDSGALITARNAAEQGRDVFAVPGPITSSLSRGPARLLKEGAILAESAADIATGLGFDSMPVHEVHMPADLTAEERAIATNIAAGFVTTDELVHVTKLTSSVVAATLTVLEMRGIVRNYGNKTYGLTGKQTL
jgi:DNA processing protein